MEPGPTDQATDASRSGPTLTWSTAWRIWLLAVGVVVSLYAASRLQGVFLVVGASMVIALGVQPAVSFLERHRMSRGLAVAVLVGAGVVASIGFLIVAVPLIATQIGAVVEDGPRLLEDLRSQNRLADAVLEEFDLGSLTDGAGLTGIVGNLFDVFTVAVLAPYFAYSLPQAKVRALRMIHRDDRQDFIRLLDESVSRVSGYVAGNFTISIVAGAVSFIVLAALGVPYPAALAVWIALTDLIPIVGVFLGAAPAIAIAGVESGAGTAIAVAVFVVIYQQIENYVVAPRVMKRAVDLSPAVVILALMIGGSLAGVLGALLALPVAALVSLLVTEFAIDRRVERLRLEAEQGSVRPHRPGRTRPPLP